VSRDEFLIVMALLGAAFPSAERQEPTFALWWDELKDTSYPAAEQAARSCARRCRFYPSLAEYLEELRHAQLRLRNSRPLELGPAPDEPLASPETVAAWLHEMRTKLAALAQRDRTMLSASSVAPYRAKSRVRPCVAPDCGRLTSRGDGRCLYHRPEEERQPLSEDETP
jgi:hypothetical protein